MTPPPTAAVPQRRTTWRRQLLGLASVVAAGLAVVAPALWHGTALGPIDWLSQYGLSAHPGVTVHNRQTFDQATQMIPWTTLNWRQVHAGHLPLWNPYSGLGLPLAFNWQSASFGLPSLIGYLVPLHLAYTVEILVVLVIAGTGVYVLGRLLGLGVLGCAVAGIVFEASGPMVGWLGYPEAWVMAWSGWLLAATVVVLRGRHRVRGVLMLAGVVTALTYAGQPDSAALMGLALVVFVVALCLLRGLGAGDGRPVLRPLADLAVALVAGAALGAPLLLPGLQLGPHSVRGTKGTAQALALTDLTHLVVQGFDGLPLAGSAWFGPSFYVRTAAYVGVIGLVLAALGVGAALRRRRRQPELLAMGAVALSMAAVVFLSPVMSFIDALPSVGPVTWNRCLLPMACALAVLAGVGADLVVRGWTSPNVRRATVGGFAAVAVVLVLMWAVGRGRLPAPEAAVRLHSLLWPAVGTVGALAVTGVAVAVQRRVDAAAPGRAGRLPPHPGRWLAACLAVMETALLLAAGAPIESSSPQALTPTPAEATLARDVGSALVGLGSNACFTRGQLGIVPDANVALSVHELAVYDPLFPVSYYSSWLQATGTKGAPKRLAAVPYGLFCPVVSSVAVARLYGIGFVLEPHDAYGPPGTVFVGPVGDEELYRVPGAAAATVVPAAPGVEPPVDATGTAVPVTHPGPAAWRVVVRAARPGVLRLRLTDVPGWHATLDGRPLALRPFAGVMLQARVPAGRHVVELRYWPSTLRAGLVLAGAAVVGLSTLVVVAAWRRRLGRRGPPAAHGGHYDARVGARAVTAPSRH